MMNKKHHTIDILCPEDASWIEFAMRRGVSPPAACLKACDVSFPSASDYGDDHLITCCNKLATQ